MKANEDAKVLKNIDYDNEAITKMIEQNVLNIGKIKLFVVETTEREVSAFYYSENVLEANALHEELFSERPKRLVNGSHLLGKLFDFDERRGAEILYFHRTKVVTFPYYLGHARAGENYLYQGGGNRVCY